jgi:uncharacterized protein (TIGR02453 family)
METTHFSPAALKFLRGLKRNNDREWFNARKELYENELKAPMLALIGEVNATLADVAPDYVRAPEKTMMRIYRDIRFSNDKRPYKAQVAAWWSRRGMEKTSGGGFYFHVSATEVRISAGVFMPEREQLLAIRRHLLEHHAAMRTMLAKLGRGRRPMQEFDGLKLTRAPKGFPADHPALDLIMQRQWGVGTTLPAEVALEPGLGAELVARMKAALPLVELLNEPIRRVSKEPLF